MTTKYPIVLHLTRGQIAMLRNIAQGSRVVVDPGVERLMKIVVACCVDPPTNAPGKQEDEPELDAVRAARDDLADRYRELETAAVDAFAESRAAIARAEVAEAALALFRGGR